MRHQELTNTVVLPIGSVIPGGSMSSSSLAPSHLDAPTGPEPARLVVAAPSMAHPHLRRVVEAFCSLGSGLPVELLIATTDQPEDVAPILMSSCAGLDLTAAAPIDLVHLDDVTTLKAGDLGVFLGGEGGNANLAAALDWISARRSEGPAAPPAATPQPTRAVPSAPAVTRSGPPPLAVVLGHSEVAAERLEHLRTVAGEHREVERRIGAIAGVDAMSRVAEVCRPLGWIDGYLSMIDAQFVYDMVAAVRPTRVLEIGTASGYSAAVILRALADAHVPLTAADGRPAVLSYDIATTCYWDASRRVGSAVAELVPNLAPGVEFITGTSVDAAATLAPAGAQLAFIDANHEHPWPTIDVLMTARLLRPGSWIILHDVRLEACGELYGRIMGADPQWHQHGSQVLFEHWPYERLIERITPGTNIAAIRLPEDRTLTVRDLANALLVPWEAQVPDSVLAALETLES
jgi:hypothetical protein